jgi:hypothetical protein
LQNVIINSYLQSKEAGVKAHTVKSNAKRAARKLADAFKWRCLEAAEPVAADGAWHPAVQIIGANKDDPAIGREIEEYVAGEAVILGPPVPTSSEAPGHTDLMISPEAIEEACDAFTAEDLAAIAGHPAPAVKPAPVAPTKPKPADMPAKPKPLAGAGLMSAIRAIPPTRSSAEEIDARRAERRARVEEEKAAGTRDRFGNKVDPEKVARGPSRAAIIVALVSQPGGALVDDILTATGWQRHTLRGYIAGTLRKRGHDIRSVKGKPARYVMGGSA